MISIKDKVSIYIHWPFCKSKCPYCDFNSHVTDKVDHKLWLDSFITELKYYENYLNGKEIISIFFGGGTPSLADESVIEGIINEISTKHHLSSNIEITLEANPTSVEAKKFKKLAIVGVNRLSLGIQSLQIENLKFLGREHSVTEALDAIELARKNFPRYSFDLIYALPNQSIKAWELELKQALKLAEGHLSLYQLTIEKGTQFYKEYNQKAFTLPNDKLAANMYLITEEILNAAGYNAYEVSNYAKPSYESIHNMQYWKYGDYVGIGPGAHGRITEEQVRYATQNISSPTAWLNKVKEKNNGLQRKDILSSDDIFKECVIMGLRTTHGIDYIPQINANNLAQLVDNGLLLVTGNKIVATLQGRLLLNSVIKHLI